jgi:hypothetical protein
MSLLKKIKENISKREEDGEVINMEEEDFVEIPTMLPSFTFYGHNWVVAPFMNEIFKGRFELIPVECVLTMYILRYYNICYYVVLDNSETGDDFSVYEFEWIGGDGERTHGVSEHCSSLNGHGERTHGVSEHCSSLNGHGERTHGVSEHCSSLNGHGERTHGVSEHCSSLNGHGERTHGVSEHGSHEHGEHGHNDKQEDKDPEFVEYATNMTALDAGKFLRERISEGYYIYIQERF